MSNDISGKNCILIVDDDFINRAVLQNIFSQAYSFEESDNGQDALERIMATPEKFCAILLDVNMPGMNGMEVLRILNQRGITSCIPVFLITANDEMDIAREAYALGVMDVINKPVVSFIILRRVQSVIELFQARESLSETVANQHKQLEENEDTIDELNRGTIEALASAIEFRDTESGEHTNRIYSITKCILTNTEMGEELTAEEIENISVGSIMHDLGKIAISDMILNKPGKLTVEEFEVMKQHTTKGAELMQQLTQLQAHPCYAYACDIARHHHERWDGRGYPDGLKGNEISIWAQVVSIADVYDALVSPRVYKKAFSPEKAVRMIIGGECGAFNPRLLDCFMQVELKIRGLYSQGANSEELKRLSADSPIRGRKNGFAAKGVEEKSVVRQEVADMFLLTSAIMSSFEMIICSNLTKNSFYIMNSERFQTHCTGNDGVFDELIHNGALSVPESHRQQFIDHFSREKLLKDFAEGRRTVILKHPQYADNSEIRMVRTTVVLLEETRSGDVMDLTFSRYIDKEWEMEEARQKQLEELDVLAERIADEGNVDLSELRAAIRRFAESEKMN